MKVLKLSAKNCMSHLLLKETFDSFLFVEGEITTFNKFTMDGFLQKDFFDEKPERNFSFWKEMKEFCLSIIKGKRTPLDFKIVLSLDEEAFKNFNDPANILGLYLNFHYDGKELQCVTGTSLKTFTMDKTTDHQWDEYVLTWFKSQGIEIDEVI